MYISQSQQKSGSNLVRKICRYTGTPFHLPRRLITYQCTLLASRYTYCNNNIKFISGRKKNE